MATEPNQIDRAAVFKQLDEYPWDTDRVFQGGLAAILGNNPQPEQIYNLTIRAQCFYLSRKLSIPIDFDAYKKHLTTKPHAASAFDSASAVASSPQPDNNITPFTTSGSSFTTTGSSSDIPTSSASDNDIPASSIPASTSTTTTPQSTITAASSIDDSVVYPYAPHGYKFPFSPPGTHKDCGDEKREPLPYQIAFAGVPTTGNEEKPVRRASSDGGAPYPAAFAEIVEKILTGQPIPGIKEFSPVVSNWEISGRKGELPIRRKPWERDVPEEQVDGIIGLFGDHRDIYIPQDLPEE